MTFKELESSTLCESCWRVTVPVGDARALNRKRFTYEPVDKDALPICSDCEDKELFPEVVQ